MKLQVYHWPKDIPWYLKFFTLFDYNRKEVEIGFTVPFKFYATELWFAFPEWLYKYQYRDCVTYIPDVLNYDGTLGIKVKPFLRMRLQVDEYASMNWYWWKNIKYDNGTRSTCQAPR